MKLKYLKQNISVDPLVNNWYATLPMIAPVQYCMYLTNYHLKIMQSFLTAPELHQETSKDAKLAGGPFANLRYEDIQQIEDLVIHIQTKKAHLVEFAKSIIALDKLLCEKADGYTLEPLYQEVPEPLKGYVELIYDHNHHPSIRFIEGLLYNTPYFDTEGQCIRLTEIHSDDDRSFVLSTPRIKQNNVLEINLPFSNKTYDRLFSAKNIPTDIDQLKQNLLINHNNVALFESFFTDEPPKTSTINKPEDNSVAIHYFGHACLLIQTQNTTILTDPLLSYHYSTDLMRYTYADLPKTIDYVVISHSHLDHIVLESLIQLRHKIKHIIVPKSGGDSLIDPSLKLLLQHLGFEHIIELEECEKLPLFDGSIQTLPFLGEHHDLNIRSKAGYSIKLLDQHIYIATDSANLEPACFDHIHQLIGDVDHLFIGMECDGAPMHWFYGPLATQPISRKINFSRLGASSDTRGVMSIVEKLNVKSVYIYAMGLEPWSTYILTLNCQEDDIQIIESNKVIEICRRRGMVAKRLYVKDAIYLKQKVADLC